MNELIPHLSIEILGSGLIRLENESMGDSYAVDLHLIQLRYLAEKMGLIHEMSATDADMLRMVAKLKRRMLVLQKRVDHLASWLCLHSDSQRADLSYEQDYATATADICEEFCADLDEMPSHTASPAITTMSLTQSDGSLTEPSSNPAETQRVNGAGETPPKTGALKSPKNGGVPAQAPLELAA
ncbi:MAG: hypothetical protein H7255_00990 [Ramlibacter sp.]|nr:hypothetical protein [Ramlibacter sp.]